MEFFGIMAGIAIVFILFDYYVTGDDSTDKPKKKWWHFSQESGLRTYVDQATGVHYIKSGPFERLQVRLNANGTPYTGK